MHSVDTTLREDDVCSADGESYLGCIFFTAWGGGGDAGERADEEREQALNQLLSEMDGFTPDEGIVFIAATNRADLLDPALMRAGRFDRKIRIARPDAQGRYDILKVGRWQMIA